MERCADLGSQLEIDEWILDYLVFMALKGVLKDHKSAPNVSCNANLPGDVDLPLQMVDSYLMVFRAMHPGYSGSPELQFRLRHLKFATMYTRRVALTETTPSIGALARLRDQRQTQAISFRSSDQHLAKLDPRDLTGYLAPLEPPDKATTKKGQLSRSLTPQDGPPSTLIPSMPSTSLLDSLPFFMALSAVAQTSMVQTTITKTWMRLAAGYMAQAAIEQYLVYGRRGHEVLQEAFAWGFDAKCVAEEGSDEWHINAMFWGEDEIVPGWEEIRDSHIRALVPPAGTDLHMHLHTLKENDLPIPKFEECMIEFLDGLLRCQPMPILAQIERGEIDGLSRKEAQAFKEAIGIT